MIEAKKHYCENPSFPDWPDGPNPATLVICAKRAIGKYKGFWYCPEHLALMNPDFAVGKQ